MGAIAAQLMPGQAAPLPSPAERFLEPLRRVEATLRSQDDPASAPDRLTASDIRSQLFRLEVLFNIYSRHYGNEFERNRRLIKEFEDAVGAYAYSREMIDFAHQRGASPAKLEELRRRQREASHRFSGFLSSREWLTPGLPAIERLKRDLQDARWMSYEEDRAMVLNEIARDFQKINDTAWDMNQLERGIHDLRKELRWFPYEVKALGGLIQVSDAMSCTLRGPRGSARIEGKYGAPLATGNEPSPCAIPACVYNGVAKLVSDLGNIKDEGQGGEAIDGGHGDRQLYAEAHRLYKEMRDTNLLPALVESLQSCVR
ncbi:MAG: hypothetical protein NDJ89_07470 [Oligoflexia bacterium]|nr:hypothetical protein [Oligoflexia bacterium]